MDELVKAALSKVNESVGSIPWEEVNKYRAENKASDIDFTNYVAKAIRLIRALESALKAL